MECKYFRTKRRNRRTLAAKRYKDISPLIGAGGVVFSDINLLIAVMIDFAGDVHILLSGDDGRHIGAQRDVVYESVDRFIENDVFGRADLDEMHEVVAAVVVEIGEIGIAARVGCGRAGELVIGTVVEDSPPSLGVGEACEGGGR